jgi:hypothetical protein
VDKFLCQIQLMIRATIVQEYNHTFARATNRFFKIICFITTNVPFDELCFQKTKKICKLWSVFGIIVWKFYHIRRSNNTFLMKSHCRWDKIRQDSCFTGVFKCIVLVLSRLITVVCMTRQGIYGKNLLNTWQIKKHVNSFLFLAF